MDQMLVRLMSANEQNDKALRDWFRELYEKGSAGQFYDVLTEMPPTMWPPGIRAVILALASAKFNELLEQLHDPNRIDFEA